jgi:hypothetical protein
MFISGRRNMVKASKAMSLFFFNKSVFAFIGIWLKRNNTAHWFSRVVPGFFLFSAVFGICPSLITARKIVGED